MSGVPREEIEKLKKAKLICEVAHPQWVANPVVAPKATGDGRLCVDFTDLNKACPKDPYPLPRIDQIVDSKTGYDLLCFLDAFSGYHQIKMAKEDEEKIAFITPCDREARTIIADLKETFANLRKVNIKLHPAKCAFGVPSGKLLGFLVSHLSIEANLDKIKAIEEMRPPRQLKDMQRLAGCMAALGSCRGLRGPQALPHEPSDHGRPTDPRASTAVLGSHVANSKRGPRGGTRRANHHQGENHLAEVTLQANLTKEASLATGENLAEPPGKESLVESSTGPHEEPALAPKAMSLVQHPVYFVSTVMRDAREHYTMQQKLLYTLLIASRKLRHYFQGHPIKVVTAYPWSRSYAIPMPPATWLSGPSSYNPSS
ncbi:hypothetical protein ACQ4PT_063623 [Festuca glaucescens]